MWRVVAGEAPGMIMNRFAKLQVLVVCVAVLVACAPKAPDTAADEAVLRADPSAWFEAYGAGNAEAVANLYAADALLMAPGAAAVSGRPAIREYIASDIALSKSRGVVLNLGEVTGVGVDGDTGWLSGNFSAMDGSGAVVDRGKFLSVYSRTGEGWKLIRDTWNSDLAPVPAEDEVVEDVSAD
jgi:uncharacterized protein (TIGR02246 family)